jgi:hypothetical protein
MRRPVTLLAAVAVLAGTAACSGSSNSTPPSGRAGNPSDTASPTGTVAPPSPQVAGTPTVAGEEPTVIASGTDLPGCMIGTWTAPVSREFDNLHLQSRTAQAVRGGTGVLTLNFTNRRTWTFSYDQVRLQLPTGEADVSGPIKGTWTLSGNDLSTTVLTSSVTATVNTAGIKVSAPGPLVGVLNKLPPNQTKVTCTGTGLEFQLPSSQGGGTVTFDKPVS